MTARQALANHLSLATEEFHPQKHKRTVAGGRCSSVAEYWQLKPEALGSTAGGATFLSCPPLFQRSTVSNGPDSVFGP